MSVRHAAAEAEGNGGGRGAADRRERLGLFLPGSEALAGGGGAERFCADLFRHYRSWPQRRFDPFLLTDRATAAALEAAGRLDDRDGVVLLGEGKLSLASPAGHLRAQRALDNADLRLLHLPHVYARYLPTVWLWSRRQRSRRRRGVTLQVVDATLKDWFAGRRLDREQRECRRKHLLVLRALRFAALQTWYPDVAAGLRALRLRGEPPVCLARCCFADTDRFRPAAIKERTIVFAARLVACKRPLLFLESLKRALELDREAFAGWQVAAYGSGPLEGAFREALDRWRLGELVTLQRASDLAATLAASRLAVSTQAGENFSSLFLLEAMAAGNAVLALDVGETRRMVDDGVNGLVVDGDPVEAIAGGLVRYLRTPELHDEMGRQSRRQVETRFSVAAGVDEFDRFWRLAVDGPAPGARSTPPRRKARGRSS